MAKRLGMWNRLAIVAILLFSFGAPSWYIISENMATAASLETGYELCVKAAYAPESDGSLSAVKCGELWDGNDYMYKSWDEWGALVGVAFVFSVLVYGLIRAAVATIKWIWRGRSVGTGSLS